MTCPATGNPCPRVPCPGSTDPGICRHRAALTAWRAIPDGEKMARFAGGSPVVARSAIPLIRRAASPTGRIRVGLLAPCLHRGGAETHQLALVRATRDRVDWRGVAVLADERSAEPSTLAETRADLPVTFGRAAARELAEGCDVLVSWLAEDHAPLVRRIIPRPKVLFVDHFPHDGPPDPAMRWVLGSVDRIVGVSELCVPGWPAEFAGRSGVIWHGVDPARLARTRSRAEVRDGWGIPLAAKVAGYLSRLDPRRGPDAMIRLAAELPEPWHVVVIGDPGPYVDFKGELDRAVAELPGSTRRRFRMLPPVAVPADALAAFDVLCAPVRSDGESWGYTVAEAILSGVPVVSTPTGLGKLMPGLTEVVPFGPSGAELAAAVLGADLAGTPPPLRDELRRRADIGRFGRQWADLIERLAREPDPDRIAFEVENCRFSTCGCPASGTRDCSHPRHPARVSRSECLACPDREV